jgi:exosortase D (VPLPA-CTERM-specific)
MNGTTQREYVWRFSPQMLWLIALLMGLLVVIYYDGLKHMVNWWSTREEYSHGFLIPLISAFLIWQRKDQLEKIEFKGSWVGLGVAIFGLLVFMVGELATLYSIVQYGFVITLAGVIYALIGWPAFKIILIPICMLFFMVPLPNFIYFSLSQKLQLLSSAIGVWVIRLFGISVFLEGNVIDLGSYKLQVVEACNGLRYLFPLMTLGFIVAYFFQAPMWQRIFVFLSTIPITVLMNSFRIGVIGVLVEYWGQSQAEGFLHDFEGWVIFMACFGILFIEMWLFARFSRRRSKLREVFGLDMPSKTPIGTAVRVRTLPAVYWITVGLLVCTAVPTALLPQRAEAIPSRQEFIDFPMTLGDWNGRVILLMH